MLFSFFLSCTINASPFCCACTQFCISISSDPYTSMCNHLLQISQHRALWVFATGFPLIPQGYLTRPGLSSTSPEHCKRNIKTWWITNHMAVRSLDLDLIQISVCVYYSTFSRKIVDSDFVQIFCCLFKRLVVFYATSHLCCCATSCLFYLFWRLSVVIRVWTSEQRSLPRKQPRLDTSLQMKLWVIQCIFN